MVTNLVKVISAISLYLLCNSISSVHSGPGLEINGEHKQDLLVTTFSSLEKEPVEDVSPIDPPVPTINPTEKPPTPAPTSSTTPATTVEPSTSKPTTASTTTTTPVTPAPSPASSSTVAPAPTAMPPTPTPSPSGGKDRHFDGPSFIGGIVLAAGLSCIGFVGFKMYRARTERNYHTL